MFIFLLSLVSDDSFFKVEIMMEQASQPYNNLKSRDKKIYDIGGENEDSSKRRNLNLQKKEREKDGTGIEGRGS